jgi:hypothetical protein
MRVLPKSVSKVLLGESEPGTRATLVAFNINVGSRVIFETLCTAGSIIVTAYALSLGIDKNDMGYLPACMYLAVGMQVFCLYMLPSIKNPKHFAISIGAIEPMILIALVALMPLAPAGLRLPMFIAFVLVAAGSMQLTRPIIDDWIAQSIPERVRPAYLSRRAQVIAVMQIVVGLSFAWLADFLGKTDPVALGGMIIFGCGMGLLSLVTLQGAKAPKADAKRPSLRDCIGVFWHKPFTRVMIVILGFNLPFYFAAPYYQTFNLDVLKMTATQAATFTVIYSLSKIIALFMAAKLIKRLGSRVLLLISTPFYALFFLTFLFCTPDRYWPLYIAWFFIGMCDGTYNVVVGTELYKAIPRDGPRTTFFATYNILSLVCYGVVAAMVPSFLHLLQAGVPWVLSKLGSTMPVSSDLGLYSLYALAAVLMLPCGLSGLAMSKKDR